jgi:hypothetical protein
MYVFSSYLYSSVKAVVQFGAISFVAAVFSYFVW